MRITTQKLKNYVKNALYGPSGKSRTNILSVLFILITFSMTPALGLITMRTGIYYGPQGLIARLLQAIVARRRPYHANENSTNKCLGQA